MRSLIPICAVAAVAAADPAMTVAVAGLTSTDGRVVVMVFAERDAEAFPTRYDRALRTLTVPIAAGGSASAAVGPLPAGRYAVRVHHDVDADGVLPKRFFRPQEGLGFSNDAPFRTFGPPRFADAAVDHPRPGGTVAITVIRYP
jgi:uncharacterized protein (DUF2141 family)